MVFQFLPPETYRWKKIHPPKISAPVSHDLAKTTKQSANGSYKPSWKVSVTVTKRSGQWGLSNQFQKNDAFLTKTGQKIKC